MESNGWSFNTTHSFGTSDSQCGNDSWYGFSTGSPDGAVSATVKGNGIAILNYGNCLNQGLVKAYLNGLLLSTATPNAKSKTVIFIYSKGDMLEILEFGTTIIKLNAISFHCSGN